jgi:hypothetical protein
LQKPSAKFLKTSGSIGGKAASLVAVTSLSRRTMPASKIPNIQPNEILVQRTRMGGSDAYIGAVTLQWLADRVKYALEMGLLSNLLQQRRHEPGYLP